jgi:hypothetical protein
MAVISIPDACRDLMAASRPDPGPFTQASAFLTPLSIASLAAAWAAICAAKGVLFFDPLKPILPEVDQQIRFPLVSVMLTMVLLKVAWIWATALDSVDPNRFLTFFFGTSGNLLLLQRR